MVAPLFMISGALILEVPFPLTHDVAPVIDRVARQDGHTKGEDMVHFQSAVQPPVAVRHLHVDVAEFIVNVPSNVSLLNVVL